MIAVDVVTITISLAVESCARIEACAKKTAQRVTRRTRLKGERDDIANLRNLR